MRSQDYCDHTAAVSILKASAIKAGGRMRPMMENNPVLIEITRGNMTESAHRGAFIVVEGQHMVVASAGNIDYPIYS